MSDDLDESIRQNAVEPAKASGDSGSVEQHPLSEQIAAAKFLAAQKAARSKTRGLQFSKLVPPGA